MEYTGLIPNSLNPYVIHSIAGKKKYILDNILKTVFVSVWLSVKVIFRNTDGLLMLRGTNVTEFIIYIFVSYCLVHVRI